MIDVPTESDTSNHGLPEQTGKSSHEEQGKFSIKKVLAEMREKDTKQKEEIISLREGMRSMISYIKGKSKDESVTANPLQMGPTNNPQKEYSSGERPSTK
ncbi:hypothetical protein K3495_g7147 [Podosphaera aphanis]|nr:hypothetical protein K3495_g7147 [Podosphaera aphanis]